MVLTLPALASFDDGAADWTATAGWMLAAHEAGQGWVMSSAASAERLTWRSSLDLTTAVSPLLTFQSQYVGVGVASVLVSSDGGATWQAAAVVANSAEWTTVNVDLSAYAGSVIQLAFDWQGIAGDQWGVDTVLVADVLDLAPSVGDAS